MPLTVLSDSTKVQLQQERDRLTRERQSIMQSVAAAAIVEIDQTLVHLEGLLGVGAIDSSPSPASSPAQATPTQPKAMARSTATKLPRATRQGATGMSKTSGQSAQPIAAKSPAKVKAVKATVAKEAKPVKAIAKSSPTGATPSPSVQLERFDPKRLKARFGGQTPQAAIMQAFQESPTQAFSQDDLINRLYDEFPPQDLIRARRSVSLTLMWSTKRGELVRVQADPALYQLAPKRG